MPKFSHLHCHTQYSLLDGASSVQDMIKKAKADGQPAVAITDHGNMFGAFEFARTAEKEGIKPIIGCEFYLVKDRFQKEFKGGGKDKRFHQLILAKNEVGYKNLSKLCTLGFLEGQYSKFPRIDKDLLRKYGEGLIATSCCIGAEIPQAIAHQGEEKAEEILKEYLEIFGSDYYVELQRHHIQNIDGTGISQEDVNQVLLKLANKYNVPVIATNDSHYMEKDDWDAHDILLCVNTGSFQSTPIGQGKDKRFGFPNQEFYFKTTEEMNLLFKDVPQAIDNTNLVVDSIETPKLTRDIILPSYQLPEGYQTQFDYLRDLAFAGAKKRYGEITSELEERLNFELTTIKGSEEQGKKSPNYSGYFLIVQDFTQAARDMGVWVGPGRGSAAGSVVAYCLGITNVDPIKYGLLFERFLNPERVSMPDVDIDFDDKGRDKVIQYCINKYGKKRVAQIVTYGTMAAKSSIRDVGRVMNYPLQETDKLAKMLPDNVKLKYLFNHNAKDIKEKYNLDNDQLDSAKKLKSTFEEKNEAGNVLRKALSLEGSVRNTGVHACGIIISSQDLEDVIPLASSKESDLPLVQFDVNQVEDAGLLKMDFLGLRTLSILKDAVKFIKYNTDRDLDLDNLPLDDEKTFQLFQEGKTVGIFQFESPGMRKHMINLKPNKFEDLIAMNALYRPGPMKFIPNYINRKHGIEKVSYPVDAMQEILEETYGITVYQEQVMLLSQKLAGFTKGEADKLRKAMGKKIIDILNQLKPKFLNGAKERGHDTKILEQVWKDWEEFAKYAFNKSHSTCYAQLAYQSAYLKANYPAEFMAAILTNNMKDIKKLATFLDEAKILGIEVLGPDINESFLPFSVNKNGQIRFGMAAIKGMGTAAAKGIIAERQKKGKFKDIFDLTSRVDQSLLNKKSLEVLAKAGAFDAFENCSREQLLDAKDDNSIKGLELAQKFGAKLQHEKMMAQTNLFGGMQDNNFDKPRLPDAPSWSLLKKLNFEKEVLGIYVSSHPLDKYKKEIEHFCSSSISEMLENPDKMQQIKKVTIAAMVNSKWERRNKQDAIYCNLTLEDTTGQLQLYVSAKDYAKFKGYLEVDNFLIIDLVYENSYYQPDKYEFKLKSVSYLGEVLETKLNNATIELSPNEIDHVFFESFSKYAIEGKEAAVNGVGVNLVIKDDEEGLKLYMQSRLKSLQKDQFKNWIEEFEKNNFKVSIS